MAKEGLLVVDGDAKSLRVLEVSLRQAGFSVAVASSVEAARAKLEAATPALILAALRLPDGDGLELLGLLREQDATAVTPVLMLADEVTAEERVQCLELGVAEVLERTAALGELITRIRLLLQRQERAKLEAAAAGVGGAGGRARFVGQLSQTSLIELVQLVSKSGRAAALQLRDAEGRFGAIYFRGGKVVDAEHGRQTGAEAVYRLLLWADGEYELEFKSIRRRDLVPLAVEELLAEGLARAEQWGRLSEGLPPLDRVVEVDDRALATRLAELPDEINGVLRLLDGRRSLAQVIDESDFADLEALWILNKLASYKLLVVVERDRAVHLRPQAEAPELEGWLSGESASAPAEAAWAPETDGAWQRARRVERSAFEAPGWADGEPAAELPSEEQDDETASSMAQTQRVRPGTQGAQAVGARSQARTQRLRAGQPQPYGAALVAAEAASRRTLPSLEIELDDLTSTPPRETLRGIPAASEASAEVLAQPAATFQAARPGPTPDPADVWGSEEGSLLGQAAQAGLDPRDDWGEVGSAPVETPILQPLAGAPEEGQPAQPSGAGAPVEEGRHAAPEAHATGDAQGASAHDTSVQAEDEAPEGAAGGDAAAHDEGGAAGDEEGQAVQRAVAADEATSGAHLVAPQGAAISATEPEPPVQERSSEAVEEDEEDLVPQSGRRNLLLAGAATVGGLALLGTVLFGGKKPEAESEKRPPVSAAAQPSGGDPTGASASAPAPTGNVAPGESGQPASAPGAAPAELAPAAPPPPAAADPAPPPGAPVAPPAPSPVAPPAPSPVAPPAPADGDFPALLGQAKALQSKGQAKKALAALDQALAIRPNDDGALALQAQIFLDRGAMQKALASAEQAVATNANNADAQLVVGTAQQALGKNAEAKAAYEAYLRLAPKGAFASEIRSVLSSLK